jgi:aminoglycoside phosphotransferase (APT) family kinase protein
MSSPNEPALESKDDARVIAWLEAQLGGRVVSWQRQPRWRPMWFVDVERDGLLERVVVRGERSDTSLIFPLEHEMLIQRLLDEHGIPVPPVYGWCDEPRSYAMAAVPGRPDFAGTSDAERQVVVDEYLQVLARMHQLPVDPFKAAGVVSGASPNEAALVGKRRYDRHFRSNKIRPDPLMEFVLGWLDRHPLPESTREAPIVWDSGQFHHQDGHLVALVDIEIGHLGDPMMDLAAWRMRETVIPYGNFTQLYDRYAELTGRPVDLAAIQWHHLFFTLTNQLSFHGALARPVAETDYMTYAQWVSETNLHAIETLAEYLAIDLEPVPIPEPIGSPVSIPHEHLSRSLRSISVEDPFVAYQVRIAFRLARHLGRFDQIGAAVTEADREDLAALIGTAPKNWDEGEALLENFVLADEGRHDDELVILFNRRLQRYKSLMGPPGSAMAAHHRLQPFGRTWSA